MNANKLYRVPQIAVLYIMLFGTEIFAQKIITKSVTVNFMDASASTNRRADENGVPCALLKVAAINKNVEFSGDIVGEIENKVNEYWVYMKNGSDKIVVSAPSYSPNTIVFSDYDIDHLESKITYSIVLSFDESNFKDSNTNNELAFSKYKEAALTGNPSALVELGKCYLYGLGTLENPSEATRCFDKAAVQGNAEAMFFIGNSFYFAQGNPVDYEKAVNYYTKAAKKDYAPAIYYLGLCYENGKGVTKNSQKAYKYYMEAAKKGYAKAKEKVKLLDIK